jgi:type II secretory pathway pseudopilin PulG
MLLSGSHGTAGRRAVGFTLVEMLVVVAIIMIVVALLMPSLGNVRQASRRVICQSQLRQVHMACKEYGGQNRGYLPKIKRESNEAGPFYRFHDLLRPFTGGFDVFHCPDADPNPHPNSNARNKRLDYGINHYGFDAGHPDYEPGKFLGTLGYGVVRRYFEGNLFRDKNGARAKFLGPPHPSKVANTDVVYLSDADTQKSPEDIGGISRNAGTLEWPIRWSFEQGAYIRHMNGYNYLRLDGSADWEQGLIPSNELWFIRKVGTFHSQDTDLEDNE